MPSNNRGRRVAGREERGMMIVTSRPVRATPTEPIIVLAEAFVDAHNDTSNLNNTISQQKVELKKVRAENKKQKKTITQLEQRPPDSDLDEAKKQLEIVNSDIRSLTNLTNECLARGYVVRHISDDDEMSFSVTKVMLKDGTEIKKPLKRALRQAEEFNKEIKECNAKIKALEKFIEDCSKEQDEVNKQFQNAGDIIIAENLKLKDFCATLLTKTSKKDLFEACADFAEETDMSDVRHNILSSLTVSYDNEISTACVS